MVSLGSERYSTLNLHYQWNVCHPLRSPTTVEGLCNYITWCSVHVHEGLEIWKRTLKRVRMTSFEVKLILFAKRWNKEVGCEERCLNGWPCSPCHFQAFGLLMFLETLRTFEQTYFRTFYPATHSREHCALLDKHDCEPFLQPIKTIMD